MGKRFTITEEDIKEIMSLYRLNEQESEQPAQQGEKMFCNSQNTKSIHDLMGMDEPEEYIEGIKLRKGGVQSLGYVRGIKDHEIVPTDYGRWG